MFHHHMVFCFRAALKTLLLWKTMFSVIISIFQAAGCVSNLWHQIVFKHFWGHRLVRWCENKQYFLTIHLNNLVSETLSGVKTIFLENYFDKGKIFFPQANCEQKPKQGRLYPDQHHSPACHKSDRLWYSFSWFFERKKETFFLWGVP